ncbi:NAD(P)-binding protein [Whalleya microplaca]|nr:NAD(P)-binding protein [Whalleya microplaca]
MSSSRDLSPLDVPFFPRIFLRNQFFTKPQYPPPSTNLSGSVAIVTGGNSGLGFEAARQLLSFSLSRLILAIRSADKGEAAATKLRELNPKATIEFWLLDMSLYSSIQDFARRVEIQLPRLDVVILNAGIIPLKFRTVPSTGHEEIIQINYLSTVLLASLLLPTLKNKSPPKGPGRLTIINAALSLTAKFPVVSPLLKALDDPKQFNPETQYNLSKALAHMFIWKLVDYVSVDDVIVNIVGLGFVGGTELARDVTGISRIFFKVFAALTALNLRDGASCYLDAAVVKEKESHGSYIMSWKVAPFNEFLYTPNGKETIASVWEETMSELEFADVRGILNSMKMH